MERKTYLGRYQVSIDERGQPIALERTASSVTLKAQDTASGEPVAVQIVRPGPLEQVPLDKVEADARAAQQLEHVNIARMRDFGFEDNNDIIYVREFLEGSTLDLWVAEHGPLPVAAVMRIALQGVNALAAAAFQSVTHRALQPSNLMIVPGQTPDGEWPLVKILNFGAIAPTFSRTGFTTTGPGELVQFASPEQLQGATPDFKSDIYSLGATLWFLLTGAPPRAGMVQRSRGIPKNVAAVISRMLASNPEQRPIDPLVLQEDIRACLGRAERRDSIGRRFGLPAKVAKTDPIVAATVPLAVVPAAEAEAAEAERAEDMAAAAAGPASVGRFLLRPLAWAAVLLTIGAIAAMILPGAIRTVQNWQAEKEPEAIGVKVGVPDAAANAVAANPAPQAAPATETQAAAPAAPEVSPPQDTTVAANRTAPATAASPSFPTAGTSAAATTQGQPAVAAAPATAAPETSATGNATTADRAATENAAPAIAYMNNGGVAPPPSAAQNSQTTTTQQQPSVTTTASQAPAVAANTARPATQTTEPAAPAEGPDDSAAQAQSNRQSRSAAQRNTQSESTTAQVAKSASASAEGERKTAVRSASASKSRAKTASRSGLTAEEQTELEVRQALPVTPEDERALPPVPRGSKRARYLGTTPDGALVFGMPSNERVFVSPPPPAGSPRRIIRRALPEADAPPPRAEPVDPEDLEEVIPPDEDEE
jgi:serine/threonine-protein kinase